MSKVNAIFFFENGNAAVFDEKGQQLPELQESWLLVFLRFVEERTGQAPDTINEIVLPSERTAKVFRTPEGWNWEVEG